MIPNVNIVRLISILFLVLILNNSAYGQKAYQIDWNQEWKVAGGSILGGVLGLVMYLNEKPITAEEVAQLDPSTLWSVDRKSLAFNSIKANKWSDYLANGSLLAAPSIYLTKITDRAWVESSIMYIEALSISAGLINISKYSFDRPRPYIYRQINSPNQNYSRSDAASFISGHTCLTATNCFFAAALFERAYPSSPFVPIVYGIGATIPAVTGYLRVRAGKHFFTDVLAGYIVGAGVSTLVVRYHDKQQIKLVNKGTAISLVYSF